MKTRKRVILNTKRISNVELTKLSNGFHLSFEFNGQPVEEQGEFYIDKDGYLHTTFTDDKGRDYAIKVLVP